MRRAILQRIKLHEMMSTQQLKRAVLDPYAEVKSVGEHNNSPAYIQALQRAAKQKATAASANNRARTRHEQTAKAREVWEERAGAFGAPRVQGVDVRRMASKASAARFWLGAMDDAATVAEQREALNHLHRINAEMLEDFERVGIVAGRDPGRE